MTDDLGKHKTYLSKIYFSNKVTSHLLSITDRHSFLEWKNKNLHTTNRIRDSSMVIVFRATTSETKYDPFSLLKTQRN
jgi:hypothetical protein